jgi:hypothetical protein
MPYNKSGIKPIEYTIQYKWYKAYRVTILINLVRNLYSRYNHLYSIKAIHLESLQPLISFFHYVKI